jgi:hypothetical protein
VLARPPTSQEPRELRRQALDGKETGLGCVLLDGCRDAPGGLRTLERFGLASPRHVLAAMPRDDCCLQYPRENGAGVDVSLRSAEDGARGIDCALDLLGADVEVRDSANGVRSHGAHPHPARLEVLYDRRGA